MKEGKDVSHKRDKQNARETLSVGNGISTDIVVQLLYRLMRDHDVDPDTMEGHVRQCSGRAVNVDFSKPQLGSAAVRIARLMAQSIPAQAEVPMGDGPQLSERHGKLLDEVNCTGTALALAQSLKSLAPQLAVQGSEGWAVVARRAERFVRLMHMHVTRFLIQPDCRLRHPTLDFDLVASHVDVSDTGQVQVACTDLDGGGWHSFALDELVSAGPVNDGIRAMVMEMGKAMVQDAIGEAMKRGGFPGFDTFQSAMENGKPVEVHHLQAHSEYVMEGNSPHAEPVGFEPPEDDEAFGENGL